MVAAILDLPEMRARVQRWSVAQYERLTELGEVSEQAELIRGFIVEKMSKSPLQEYLTYKLARFLTRAAGAGLMVRQEASLHLSDSVPEPDIAVVRGTPEDFLRRRPTTAELVVEVAVSSVALDRENASLYAEAGVMEYWIVLGVEEAVEVYRRPENGAYQTQHTYRRGESIPEVGVTGGDVLVEEWFP